MAVDALLGLLMNGSRELRPIPPNATREQQIAAINDIIAALNNVSRDIVGGDTVDVPMTGVPLESTTVPHNLGYKPRVFAYLDSRNLVLDLLGNVAPNANLALPTPISLTIGGGAITDKVRVEVFADINNVYFRVLNADGSVGTLPIKYLLTRDAAN